MFINIIPKHKLSFCFFSFPLCSRNSDKVTATCAWISLVPTSLDRISLSSPHSLLYLPHQTCSILNTKSPHIPIVKYFNYRNLSLQTQNSHTISTSNTSPTQTHNQDSHNLGFFSYLASSLVDFCGFARIDVQTWGILWVCWN